MNKKSFWRGFGAGVLFTAVILGISCVIRTSDSRVVSRAKKLGMVYEKEDGNTKVAQSEETEAPDEEEPKETEASNVKEDSKTTEKPQTTEPATAPTPEKEDADAKATKAPAKTSGKKDTSLEDEKKEIQKEKENLRKEAEQASKNLEIKAGEWSSDVSRRLQSMGIIKSATDFDKYLNDHGYAASISAGTYQVSPGDTYQELARKITRR